MKKITTIKYITDFAFKKYFPFENNIFGATREEVFIAFSSRLGITSDQLSKVYSIENINQISINGKMYYRIEKEKKDISWVAYLIRISNTGAYKYLASGGDSALLPKTITELFNLEALQNSIQGIEKQITYDLHPLIKNMPDDFFSKTFSEINFYKQQKRVIKEGANALLNKNRSFFFLGEMGVGKTMTSVGMFEVAKKLRNTPEARCAVIAPDHLVSKWMEEILLVNPNVTVDILPQDFSNYVVNTDYVVIPLSYCALKKIKRNYKGPKEKYKNSIASTLKGQFKLSIFDESHLLSQPKYATQLNELAHMSEQNILATGTSIAGKVTDMFPQILGFFQNVIKKLIDKQELKINLRRAKGSKKSSINILRNAFITSYGSFSYISGRHGDYTNIQPEIGLNAEFITEVVIQNSIFLTTEQVWEDKTENLIFQPIFVQMTQEQKNAANMLNSVARKAKENGNRRVYSSYLKKINEYMDNPEVPPITYQDELLWTPEISALEYYFDDEILFPKEQKLIDILTMEKSQDRPVIVFVKHIDRLKNRLQKILQDAGFKVGTLPSSRKADERQNYINKKICNEKVDVMLLDPHKVATGVDLISSPTVLFFNTGFDYFEVGQSERRSFRIGQKRQTRVYYLAYQGDNETPAIQDQILTMIAKQKRAMEAVQGAVDEEGLSSLLGKENNSILNALVSNMDNEESNFVEEVTEDKNSKQQYYISNFGKKLEIEDCGRPMLDENMNFIWNGLEDTSHTKRLTTSTSAKPTQTSEITKKVVKETVEVIDCFDFKDDGTMDLFDLEDYQEPGKYTSLFDTPEPSESITISIGATA